ncbi:MAG TPA: 5-formyltetrahydrofolate cyclo-ligase [Metabacillus sp.]|nr:5-formyltetrahydrofolate cyclo-ligase [Metabacillus sp.]
MDKSQLRQLVKKQLEELNDGTFTKDCAKIHKHLFLQNHWNKAKTIAVTISRGREIDTKNIIEKAWAQGKHVVVPKCNPRLNEMIFRKIDTFQQLETVFFGLKEPIVSKTVSVEPEDINLMIVPGICFDQEGYRIGYGGGYYDRYLERYPHDTISLAFSFQLFSKIPREPHDIPIQGLITEQGVVK